MIRFSTKTLQRWPIDGENRADKRPTVLRSSQVGLLSQAKRQALIDVCNSEEFAAKSNRTNTCRER